MHLHNATGKHAYSAHIGLILPTCECQNGASMLNSFREQAMAVEHT